MQQVLTKDDISHYTKGSGYEDLVPWLGNGILLSEGDEWKAKRKMMSYAFSASALRNLIPVFSKCADELINLLDNLPDGAQVDLLDLFTKTTLEIIGLTAFGYSFRSLSKERYKFRNRFDR